MTLTPQRDPISGPRRVARIAVAAGLVAALSAAGPIPLAFAADGPGASAPADADVKSGPDKLGSDDADLLAEAKADGDKTVTMMIATAPGKTEQVAGQLDAVKGGSVGRADDKLGYVRATVPTSGADSAIAAAAKLSSVHGIDLREEIPLDDPTPSADAAKGAKATGAYPAPGKQTPAENPYNPSFETGAVDFVEDHPKADGRGITIGILDSGVDLGHPALQKTTTGERKIVDWVTATDPVVDNDRTWRPMTTTVSGPTFTYGGKTWTAPAGSYRVSTFLESYTTGGDAAGDANRDGDTTDAWGVLYDAASGTVRVDLNNNNDFGDDTAMKPYKDGFQIGYFGTDDPATDIAERQPFVVEIRKDVVVNASGAKADFVNIGVIESEHGTHVAGITAANGLFGGKMDGAAPGAKLVSSRACTWSGGCTNVALTEGMIDLVTKRGVDIVNMSIGGLPALNDGNNARAELYTRLIDEYGVQLVISAGNSGPGTNTIGDPALADKVISVGASVSKETWAANYGSVVEKKYALMPFSSRGPREDGGFTPTLIAPGAAINTIQTWMPGAPVAEAGYTLPAGYGMLQGTSMASPQAAGSAALLLSAAKQKKIDLTPATLRTALTSTADHIKGVQAYEEGAGLMNIEDAWDSIRDDATSHAYTVKAPVDTAINQFLKTPGYGTGLYDREGGLKAGQKKTYEVTVTRTSGADKAIRHELHFENNEGGTFRIVGSDEVKLPLNQPVTVKVQAAPKSAGIKSAILEVDDPKTEGIDKQVLSTVVVSAPLKYTFSASDSVQRNSSRHYYVTVPEGAKTLEGRDERAEGQEPDPVHLHPPLRRPVRPDVDDQLLPELRQSGQHLPPRPAFVRGPAAGRVGDRGRVAPYVAAARQPVQAGCRRARRGLRPGDRDRARGEGRHPGHRLLEGDERLRRPRRQAGGRPARLGEDDPSVDQAGRDADHDGRGARGREVPGRRHRRCLGHGRRPGPRGLRRRRHAGRQLRRRRLGGVGLRALAGRREVHRRGRRLLGAGRHDRVRLPGRVLLRVPRQRRRRRVGAGEARHGRVGHGLGQRHRRGGRSRGA
ncbi:hypothetical protein SPURM210S_00444 [Streptomyces purpurascens]